MAWTSPRTWVAGEKPTAAQMNAHIRDNLKAIFTQAGSGSAVSLATATTTTVNITFPIAFGVAPKVVASITNVATRIDQFHVGVDSSTTTGCVIRVRNDTGSTVTVTFNWLALGEAA